MDSLIKKILVVMVVMLTVIFIFMKINTSTDNTSRPPVLEGKTVGDFTDLIPFTFGRISLLGSIADTDSERELGLSNTKEIPIGVAKVFIFDSSETWSFWMKDMNYPIDIFWLDEQGVVVHVVEAVSPDTYPDTSFMPTVPALYVIETKAGFAEENNIGIGAVAGLTQILSGQ